MLGHIVALGGGGFSMEPDNLLLDDFILSLSRRSPARVCFIPTASADSATYITKFSGAVLVERFQKPAVYGGIDGLRYRLFL